jgi:hypothetical protein
MLVLVWCCDAVVAGAVVLWVLWCCGCWSTRVSWSTSFALAELFYTTPLVSVGLTPLAMHLVTSCLLAWWLGRPDWVHGRYLCVSHVDKIILFDDYQQCFI